MTNDYSRIGSVPCSGCTRCCQGDAVRLLPGDEPAQYDTEPHAYEKGELMLAHKKDMSCIYLGEHGCTIYERRPRMCREADCRIIALRMTYTHARKLANYANGRMMACWRQGKDMQKKYPINLAKLPKPRR